LVDNCFALPYAEHIKYFKRTDSKLKLATKDLTLISLFTALMIAGAFIRIPFPLLPVTFQPFFCALAGLILGPGLGAASMAVYMVLGLIGIPVFANGGGIAYVFEGSFGFIAGFIACAYVIGSISRKKEGMTIKRSTLAALAGLLTMYAIGVAYMFIILRFYTGNTGAGLLYVLTVNLPYFIKDAILFIVASVMSKSIRSSVSGIKR
jgi:biotin transport system substrate-specific component